MGFRPNWTGDASTVEYTKDFAEADHRMARLTVVFSKQGYMSVMDQARVVQFIVTVTGSIDPVIEEVKQKAPPALQADMLHTLKHLEGLQDDSPPVESAHCDLCGQLLSEWTVDDAGRIQCFRPDICDQGVPDDDE